LNAPANAEAALAGGTSNSANVGGLRVDPERIHLFENHDAAYHIWRRAALNGRTLVHVDGHHDMWRAPGYKTINIANYISFALNDGIVKDVFWVVPDATWDTADGVAAIDLHAQSLAKQYLSKDRPVRLARDRVQISLQDTTLTITSLKGLPHLNEPVLLDIDVDYFVTECVCYDRMDIPAVMPWCWPAQLIEGLSEKAIVTDLVTIAYSVEGEYTPLKWKYLGDELSLRLRRTGSPDLLEAAASIRRGATLANLGRKEEAETAYRKALELWPDSYAPALHLAYLYADTGAMDQAKRMYQRALDLGGEATLRRSDGFGDFWCERYAEAERQFRLTSILDPENPFCWLGLGLVQSRRGNLSEATSFLKRAVNLAPDSVDAHRALAETLALQKQNKSAIAEYEQSLSLALRGRRPLKSFPITKVPSLTVLDPEHWKTFAQVAKLYALEGDLERAVQNYQLSLKGGVKSSVHRWRLARIYFQTHRWGKGLNEAFYALVASISRQARHFSEAVTWFAAKTKARLSRFINH